MLKTTLPLDLIHRYQVVPLKLEQNTLHLGMKYIDQSALAAIRFHIDLQIHPVLLTESELASLLKQHTQPNVLYTQLENTLSKIEKAEEPTLPQTLEGKEDEPVTEFVNQLFKDAITKRISDIHIEPFETHCRIRFRCDGLLYEAAIIPLHLAERIITRLKIMAELNIAERRLPQDGRIPLRWHEKMEMRLSTCPTIFGEKIVLRLLNNQTSALKLDELGLTEQQKILLLTKLKEPQGLILVTGPTGSGKTITLYSVLQYLNQIEKNILSVEDPVEVELPGINQINTNAKIGLDFATALRTFLRQDPDIMMVGEIRDLETAKIAMQAAQTGHLVLATLHANSAAETLARLQMMGIETYHLISAVSLIIAQRLVRKICPYCSTSGCTHCQQGYAGRVGIFELLPITQQIIDLTLMGAKPERIVDYMRKNGCETIREVGLKKVKEGITSYGELSRVIT